jgi:O-antigen ligase
MWREKPVMGVGGGQFTEHYYLTAHNSLLLALAELGPIGLLLWSAAIYYTIKVTLQAQRHYAGRPRPHRCAAGRRRCSRRWRFGHVRAVP